MRGKAAGTALSFELLIPDLRESDIFEPICQGMMRSPMARQYTLIWGSTSGPWTSKADLAWQLRRHYIERGVAVDFFAPLELEASPTDVNHLIARAFTEARIPIVLLDRTVTAYPEPSAFDVVAARASLRPSHSFRVAANASPFSLHHSRPRR
ncbi:MAG: hypothetical protein ABI910_05135 [Gemmatimonadota bacterium]